MVVVKIPHEEMDKMEVICRRLLAMLDGAFAPREVFVDSTSHHVQTAIDGLPLGVLERLMIPWIDDIVCPTATDASHSQPPLQLHSFLELYRAVGRNCGPRARMEWFRGWDQR